MASIATASHLPALEEPHEREAVGRMLEATLHELVNLALTGRQLHWAVVGPLLRALHLQPDEFVDAWRELADTVAERAVALGDVPDGQAQAVGANSRLRPVAHPPVEDHAVVRGLTDRIATASELARDGMHRPGGVDLASQEVLIGVVRKLEEQQWMAGAARRSLVSADG
ncbi:MAG TPA: ferritin-like domain-containing protein [Solirubrobacteraceae bacterium]|nr:ferritin-like domain-containing protein [Solirubrobacteraceae bacterium]